MTELENVVPSIRKTFPFAVVPGLPHCTAVKQNVQLYTKMPINHLKNLRTFKLAKETKISLK